MTYPVVRRTVVRSLASVALLAALCLLVTACGEKSPAPTGTNVGRVPALGETFPYRRFLGSDGQVLDVVEQAAGKRVLLVFMRGFDGIVCPYCTRQTAELVQRVDEIKAAGAEVYIVYPGPADTIPLFVNAVSKRMRQEEMTKLPIPLLLDVDLRAVKAIGITGNLSKPSTFVLEPDGSVTFRYVGEDMRDRPTLDNVLDVLRAPATAPAAGKENG